MTVIRFAVGRIFMHIGLRIMPRGRVRSELYGLMDQWSSKVLQQVYADKLPWLKENVHD